ncbi:contact-dependent growth inhibition system immunity protein [Herbaspirillum sp. alder98]|uniref:contact-dependent growth inhibition system immunity protein n=1 Tax=Herbaspirillum sp. alder98 TaxID=2913096 RepID=UPI001CD896A2|nr:contact-dependent growth inhibition system immunity protein [Herbaspirillum sp. alder98]MCA1325553.1 CdiI family contact-dependent growth inhibition immunity protein [Herbaspirillum sp. alder98]
MRNTSKATVYFNGDLYQVITTSQGMLSYDDPEVAAQILPSTSTDPELGAALKSALAKSKQTPVAQFQEIFKSGIVQKIAKEREIGLMQQYGYKTRKALMRKMACCWITADDDRIEIKPTHHKNIGGYSGISNDGPEILFVDRRINDEQLGASLREGFARCTSAVA